MAKFTIGIAAFISPAFAQSNIVPDNTLGSEASRIIPNFNGTPNEVIEGGAQRGQNLFHSFREFNIGENRGAYFFVFDPSIQNILARVTGSNRSDILGILGTQQVIDGNFSRSNANLFLMNPNGIVFGENARLDVGASFVATTANGIQFGNQGNFSATNPQTPGVLTVNPSALFFDAVAKQGEIVNQSITGLEVRSGRTLGLLGGNIALEGGSLFAPSGRIELGSVAPNSLVNIIPRDTAYSLSYEGINNFQDILLSQAASVRTSGNSGGVVQVQGKNISLIGGSGISANLTGNGVGGGLTVNASESVQVIGENAQADDISGLRVQVLRTGTGKGGDMTINTPTLIVKDGAQISTGVFGAGKGGNLNVNASNKIQLTGTTANGNFGSGLFSETLATGDAGDIGINTPSLFIQNGARVNSSTRAFGQGGNINIGADTIELVGFSKNQQFRSFLGSETFGIGSSASSGNVNLATRILNVRDGALVSTDTSNQGQAGDLTITARELLNVSGTRTFINGGFFRSALSTLSKGSGTAGNLRIFDTGTIRIAGGAGIFASSLGQGNGGNIEVNANRLDLLGISNDRQFASTLVAETRSNSSSARAGSINIFTNILNIRDGARISATTLDQGQGGNLTITARESLDIVGTSTLVNGDISRSGLFTEALSLGNAGNLKIVDTGSINITDGAAISASSFGQGQSGDIDVEAGSLQLEGVSSDERNRSFLGSVNIGINNNQNSGNVTVKTKTLNVFNGASISTSAFNQAQGGNITISARESLNLSGTGIQNGEIFSSGLFTTSFGFASAGNIKIFDTGLIQMQNGGQVLASTSGLGKGGTIDVTADRIELEGISTNQKFPSGFGSETSSIGSSASAGDVTLTTRILNIRNGARISTESFNQGQAGNLTVTASESLNITGIGTQNNNTVPSGLFTSTRNSGAAGKLRIVNTGIVKVQDGGRVSTSTLGQGQGGNLEVDADSIEVAGISNNQVIHSFLGSETTGIGSSANAGDVTLTTKILNVLDGARISTQTFNQGRGGNLTINARESLNIFGTGVQNGRIVQGGLFSSANNLGSSGNIKIFDTGLIQMQNGGQVLASTSGLGKGGNIDVNADRINLEGISKNQQFSSGFGSETSLFGSSANAGDVTITTVNLNIRDGARISTQTFNQGRGGNLTINARESLNIFGTGVQNGQVVGSGLFTATNSFGSAGNIKIFDTELVKIKDGGQISASTSGQGRGGNIDVNVNNLDVEGIFANQQFRSFLGSTTDGRSPNANAGNVTLITQNLNIRDGALIATDAFNQGQGGNLTVTASESLNISGARNFADGRFFRSALSTLTKGSGSAGNLKIVDTGTINILDGATVTASSIGQGQGGNIEINADTIEIAGNSVNGQFLSSLGSETSGENSSAKAGNVTASAVNLNIRDRGLVSTRSSNQGKAGNININVNKKLNLTNGNILTSSSQSSGGSINVNAENIRLFGDSDISTFVSSGAGGGGDIKLTADSILAFGDSDIFAFAQDGKGGNITFDTPAFFGENYRPASPGTNPLTLEENNQVDINASGAVSGVIVLPDTSLVQNNLGKLPQTAIDTNALIANSCIARRNQQQNGSFFITGSGGLPARPGNASLPSYFVGDVQPIPAESTTLPTQKRPWQIGDPVIEPSGVYELPNGKLVLGKEC
ncbi:MAG: filamentous hemagglutinin N-terminal domain-containing protein [Rivularia sp. (in: cyanobacteria)]